MGRTDGHQNHEEKSQVILLDFNGREEKEWAALEKAKRSEL